MSSPGKDLPRPGELSVNAIRLDTIYDDPKGRDQRQGVAALWGDSLPDNFRQADRLVIRYVYPSATLVLNETWEMTPSN